VLFSIIECRVCAISFVRQLLSLSLPVCLGTCIHINSLVHVLRYAGRGDRCPSILVYMRMHVYTCNQIPLQNCICNDVLVSFGGGLVTHLRAHV